MKVFELYDSPYKTGFYIIKMNDFKKLPITVVVGSLHMIQSALFNMDYADYLRMERDVYGATLVGKNSLFPISYYTDKERAQKLVDELNKRITIALKEREKNAQI